MPGLDGLRAIAVVAVLLYHGQDLSGITTWLEPQGGFLGVEVFFVISGFLITALLLREHDRQGTIGLRDFWVRRARRLLPALYVFLAGTIALALLFAHDAFDRIRSEILGALFYVSNWLLIATDESYFEAAGRPSLFRHLWSLAIEEQFYLVWPLIVLVGLRFGGRRTLLALTLAAAAGSTALMWMLFDRIEQYGDVTSVYYRTDARAAALLVGGALAMVWRPWTREADRPIRMPVRWGIDVLGAAALALVVAMQYWFTDRVIEWDAYTRLYHGGFLALSAATLIVILAVSTPGSALGRVLGNPVMRWIGTRSYGLYLWHWPVFQLTRPRLDVDIDGYTLLFVRLAITCGLVELSYRLIEAPVRQRRFLAPTLAAVRTPRGILLGSIGALALIAATSAVAVAIPTIDRTPSTTELAIAGPAVEGQDPAVPAAPAPTPDLGGTGGVGASDDPDAGTDATDPQRPTDLSDGDLGPGDDRGDTVDPDEPYVLPETGIEPTGNPTVEPTDEPDEVLEPGAEPTVEPGAAADLIDGNFDPQELEEGAAGSGGPGPAPTPTQAPLPPPPPLSQPFDITASRIHIVGDSVVQGAQNQLYAIAPGVTVDGRTGRQWWELEGELRAMRAQGYGNDVVVIQLGNNGNFTNQMFDGVMNALSGTRLVIFVNIHAPVVWEGEVNAMLASNVNRYPEQARLLDWYTASAAHPEYFVDDGTHLQGAGMVALRYLIENALRALS